uniref:F-box domain-containing protein n=1 Tax=Strongyloides venezuelensis TaxID=75913 RepID=A0A0K0F1A7_STRVS
MNLMDLPDEILKKIFLYLRWRTLKKINTTNRRIHKIICKNLCEMDRPKAKELEISQINSPTGERLIKIFYSIKTQYEEDTGDVLMTISKKRRYFKNIVIYTISIARFDLSQLCELEINLDDNTDILRFLYVFYNRKNTLCRFSLKDSGRVSERKLVFDLSLLMQRLDDVSLINIELNFPNHKTNEKIVVTPSESLTAVRIHQKKGTNIIKPEMIANLVKNSPNLQLTKIDVDNETDDFYTEVIDNLFKDSPSNLEERCDNDTCRLCFTRNKPLTSFENETLMLYFRKYKNDYDIVSDWKPNVRGNVLYTINKKYCTCENGNKMEISFEFR